MTTNCWLIVWSTNDCEHSMAARCEHSTGDLFSATGFLIHQNLLLTTHAIIPSVASAEAAEIRLLNGVGGSLFPYRSVDGVASIADFGGEIEVMKKLRSELVRSKSKKASHSKCMPMFMTNSNQNEEIEHIGFLSLWLSRFVFPSVGHDSVGKHVILIAVKLAQGVKLALAPAILAYVYHNLTKLKEQYMDSSSNTCVNLLGPFQLVQIWGYERFSTVGPKSPNELGPGEPRLARWHTLNSNVSSPLLHSRMINPECFIWRPYAVEGMNLMLIALIRTILIGVLDLFNFPLMKLHIELLRLNLR